MISAGISISGTVRTNNEDAILAIDSGSILGSIYIVADGMGGHNAGEVASRLAISSFLEYTQMLIESDFNNDSALDIIMEGVLYSNDAILKKAQEVLEFENMGTTFTAAVIKDSKLYVAHVGDSRLYIFRDGRLIQITRDHSYVMEMVRQGQLTLEQALNHPKKNIITKALGEKNVEIDAFIENVLEDDIILMCSDGLTNMVDNASIENELSEEGSIQQKAERLVNMANENGGRDNISIIIVSQEVEK